MSVRTTTCTSNIENLTFYRFVVHFISNDLDLPIFGFLEVTLMSTKLEKIEFQLHTLSGLL